MVSSSSTESLSRIRGSLSEGFQKLGREGFDPVAMTNLSAVYSARMPSSEHTSIRVDDKKRAEPANTGM